MTISKLLDREIIKTGKKSVVVLLLKIWQAIENRLENVEMSESKFFRAKIAKARKEKKVYSVAEVRKFLELR